MIVKSSRVSIPPKDPNPQNSFPTLRGHGLGNKLLGVPHPRRTCAHTDTHPNARGSKKSPLPEVQNLRDPILRRQCCDGKLRNQHDSDMMSITYVTVEWEAPSANRKTTAWINTYSDTEFPYA
eukprot:3236337-Amphidinium_carterae.1